jgi:hypothetical protein
MYVTLKEILKNTRNEKFAVGALISIALKWFQQ